ncbi:hypothetical protein [Mucilaginibacter psychrotolerans]|uniref:Transcriptional regulator n=1 Tax=Mucilaginibacter psychrotolerans TaxID=1524096 RepID=A0A4Y8SFF5_9SPHI|nr:hypothetical protein [Mucilaginibacter psychrotolerans]TFF37658.1 hypothetical protein E2R66_10845 [Mucilaginibacter psychrotolerans]
MKSETSEFLLLYSKITDDPRVNVWHISLYTYILSLWQKSGFKKQLKVSRKQLMKGAHFGSITTYHKCISKLKELEYITYLPTYDSYRGTVIELNT